MPIFLKQWHSRFLYVVNAFLPCLKHLRKPSVFGLLHSPNNRGAEWTGNTWLAKMCHKSPLGTDCVHLLKKNFNAIHQTMPWCAKFDLNASLDSGNISRMQKFTDCMSFWKQSFIQWILVTFNNRIPFLNNLLLLQNPFMTRPCKFF